MSRALLLAGLVWLACALPCRAFEPATPEQEAEIQGKIDEGTRLFEEWKALVKVIDKETDPDRRFKLIARAIRIDQRQERVRQEAIELVDKYYHLEEEGKESRGEPQYDPGLRCEGVTSRTGKVRIGERAFRSVKILLSTKLHEFTHADDAGWDRWPEDHKAQIMAELKAYQRELDLASKTGLSEADQADIRKRMEKYREGLGPTNAEKADQHLYRAEAIPLRDAVLYGYASVEFNGCGRASGTVFRARVTRLTEKPFLLEFPLGTPLAPDRDGVQAMMIGRDVFVSLEDGSASVDIPGYCLDPHSSPPPLPSNADRGPRWTPLNHLDTPAHIQARRVIERGLALSRAGRYHTDMPPEKYRDTVIQRSLWYLASPDSFHRGRLLQDIQRQVAESGGNQTPGQVSQLCDHLWADVELTLKER
ncbi:MAG: hypothetical protein AB1758_21200 [Candidatus Eremiobacterota bacterium]